MGDLEHRLHQVPEEAARLVIADAVFSMDGDVMDLPAWWSFAAATGPT